MENLLFLGVPILKHIRVLICRTETVKSVLVATSVKQATYINQVCINFPKWANTLKHTCINPVTLRKAKIVCNSGLSECNRAKQAHVVSKHILLSIRCLLNTGLTI